MTAKNIKRKSDELDRYFTPQWCVDQMIGDVIPAVYAPKGLPQLNVSTILDPGTGRGVFADRFRFYFPDAHITAIDIDPDEGPWDSADESLEGDFLETDWGAVYPDRKKVAFDLTAGNPPFTLAEEFARTALEISEVVIFIVRHGFMASIERVPFFVEHRPQHVFNIPNRPKFRYGHSDSADYCWMVWTSWGPRDSTILHWLHDIPKELRR